MAAEKPQPASLVDVIRKLNGTAEANLEIQLPQGGEHYYYSNFPSYSEPLKEGLLAIQQLLTTCETLVRSRHAPAPDWTDADEVANWSSELLDDVVEKLDMALDADRARARGRSNTQRTGGAAAADDASLTANLPSFGGTPVRPGRVKGPVRHVTALPRPQELFDPPPDNRREVPFRPRVEHLEGLMSETCDLRVYKPTLGASEEYPHPFAAELAALTYRPDQLQAPESPPLPPPAPEDTPLVWVNSEQALAGMVEELRGPGVRELALDLEHHSYRSFQGFTCLMQISTRSTDYVVDTLTLRNQLGPALASVFADPRVIKVLHGADSDVDWLQRDFGLFLVNMFDTGQAARVLGLPSFGLAHLMETMCGVQPDKQFQLADWRVRPLSPEMLHYARCDTHYLLYVYDKLREQLLIMPDSRIPPSLAMPLPLSNPGGALGLVLERSRLLCLKTYRKPAFNMTSYRDLLRRWHLILTPQQMAVFAALLAWRDGVCRLEDEGPGYVLSKAQLVALAQAIPEDAKRVQSVLGRAISEVVTRRLGEVLAAISYAKHRPIVEATEEAAAPTATTAAAPTSAGLAGAVPATVPAPHAAGAPTPRAAPPALKPRTVAPIRRAVAAVPAAAASPATATDAPASAPVAVLAARLVATALPTAPPAQEAAHVRSVKAVANAPTLHDGDAGGLDVEAGVELGGAVELEGEGASDPSAVDATEGEAVKGVEAEAGVEMEAGPETGMVMERMPAAGRGGAISVSLEQTVPTEHGGEGQGEGEGVPTKSAVAKGSSRGGGGEDSGGLKPRALKPFLTNAATGPCAAALFGDRGGATSTALPSIRTAGGGDGISTLRAIFSGAGKCPSQPPVSIEAAAGSMIAGAVSVEEEERAARQRAQRLRATFALPFAPAVAALAVLPAQVPIASADITDRAGMEGPSAGMRTVVKLSTTAADIRAAIEAMTADGEDTEITMAADGRSALLPPGKGGAGGVRSTIPAACGSVGRDAPEPLSVADLGSDGDGDNDKDGDQGVDGGAGSQGDGGGKSFERVAGEELGLDGLDYVPIPLSQMLRKSRADKGLKRRAQSACGAPADGATASDRVTTTTTAATGLKRQRFTTEVPPAANEPGELQYDGNEFDSSDDSSSDSDGGHSIGPFAKKKNQTPNKMLGKQTKKAEIGVAEAPLQQGQDPRRRRGSLPALQGLQADFPRSNLHPVSVAEGGRGSRGRREGRGGGGRRGGGRQPTTFNPYDIPDEFLVKGGKRSTVMPRSGNRSFTFKNEK